MFITKGCGASFNIGLLLIKWNRCRSVRFPQATGRNGDWDIGDGRIASEPGDHSKPEVVDKIIFTFELCSSCGRVFLEFSSIFPSLQWLCINPLGEHVLHRVHKLNFTFIFLFLLPCSFPFCIWASAIRLDTKSLWLFAFHLIWMAAEFDRIRKQKGEKSCIVIVGCRWRHWVSYFHHRNGIRSELTIDWATIIKTNSNCFKTDFIPKGPIHCRSHLFAARYESISQLQPFD